MTRLSRRQKEKYLSRNNEIIARKGQGWSLKRLSKRYNLHIVRISQIVNEKKDSIISTGDRKKTVMKIGSLQKLIENKRFSRNLECDFYDSCLEELMGLSDSYTFSCIACRYYEVEGLRFRGWLDALKDKAKKGKNGKAKVS